MMKCEMKYCNNINRFSYLRFSFNKGQWSLSSQVSSQKLEEKNCQSHPPKLPLKPWLSSDPGLAAFTTVISVMGDTRHFRPISRESVTWQERPSTVLRAGTIRAVRWAWGSPAGEKSSPTAAAARPEPEVPRPWLRLRAQRPDRQARRGLLGPSPLGCCFPSRRVLGPSGPDTRASAPRPSSGLPADWGECGAMRRAPCAALLSGFQS